MTKSDFLDLLREKISRLPEWEAAKTVVYYSEMIDDRIEDGMSEEEAVAARTAFRAQTARDSAAQKYMCITVTLT